MPNLTGNITLPNVEANESITVTDGSLTISEDVGSRARITLESRQSTLSCDPSTTITTISGKCYVNGGRSETRRENHSNSNTSNFFGSGTRVVNTNTVIGKQFIDGVEQRTTPSQPQNSDASTNTMPKI